MSKTRLFILNAVMSVLTALASPLLAQHEIHHGPPMIEPDGYDPDMFQPFMEPFQFDSDLQLFAPAEVDYLGGEISPPIGYFGTYDRTYLYVTRPEHEESYTQGDFTWGNRFDIGYMTDEDHGWLVSFLHVDGPNVDRILEQERINVIEVDDLVNSIPNAVDLRGGGNIDDEARDPGFPLRDRNDPVTLARDYRLRDSINNARVSSFELNKAFRINPLHYGSIIEPFLGFRYVNVDDFYQRDVYQRIDETTGALVYSSDNPFLLPPPGFDIDDARLEQLNSTKTHFDNNMFGGQIGMRWYKQKARWKLSGEVRVFAFQNFQSFTTRFEREHTRYTDGQVGADIEAVFYHRTVNSGHADEFVFGTEIRTEAAYNITRSLQLRMGIQFMDFARGIGRGNDLGSNQEDLLLVGATGGFTINR